LWLGLSPRTTNCPAQRILLGDPVARLALTGFEAETFKSPFRLRLEERSLKRSRNAGEAITRN